MAGFSIVLLILLFCWPLMLVYGVVSIAAVAAAEFIMSPAFPCMLGSILFSLLAAIDLARIVWRRFREGESFVIERKLFVRPVVLAVIAFALFVVMCVVCGSMLLEWYRTAFA